jgi:serine/threonine-protein kinase
MSERRGRSERPTVNERAPDRDDEPGDGPTASLVTTEPEGPDPLETPTLDIGPLEPLETIEVPDDAPDLLARVPAERYLRKATLGAGGMGEVGLHHDRWIGRDVALKTLHAQGQGRHARRRFVREICVQGQLEHPSIVPVYDVGADAEGQVFFTMRRVRGRTLRQILERLAAEDREYVERYSRRKLLTAFVSACLAVDYAHSRGVIHRDLKPSNIMMGEFGEVYILDWGVAGELRASADAPADVPAGAATDARAGASSDDPVGRAAASVTRTGALIGTPRYMSPEQLLGRTDEIDARSDVYALGLILFELLTYCPVHRGRGLAEILQETMEGALPCPSEIGADVPPEFDDVYARATARTASDRTASARALAEEIERYLDGDRDLERRRALAGQHARRAAEATTEALAMQRRGEDAQAARAEAMREAMRALALDPAQPDAARQFARLLVEVPEKMPAEVEREMDQLSANSRREAARVAMISYLLLFTATPLFMLLGVRSWLAPIVGMSLTVLLAAFCAWYTRSRTAPMAGAYVPGVLNVGIVATMSCWLGPFVLVPTAAAISSHYFSLQVGPKERPVAALLGVLAFVIPLTLELLHLVPPSFHFEGDRMVLLPRSSHIPAVLTLIVLVHATLTWLIFPIVASGRVRDALHRAERQLFLHAWHLRRLLGE